MTLLRDALARRTCTGICIGLCVLAISSAQVSLADSDHRVQVALISDVETIENAESTAPSIEAIFRQELLTLVGDEFEVEFRAFFGDHQTASIDRALDLALTDPQIDIVLVTGIAANQIAAVRRDYAKPTFLPILFDAQLLGLAIAGEADRDIVRGSGIDNLNYLTDNADFAANLRSFRDVVDFEHLGLLVDSTVLAAADSVTRQARAIAAEQGISLEMIPFDDPKADLVQLIPDHVDAVMTGGLIRLGDDQLRRLVEGLIDRQLPSFSFDGNELVRRGLLATDSPNSDWRRLARRTALNIQAVLLGAPTSEQPVDFTAKRQLYLNLATARAIDVYPRFDVLVEAVIYDDERDESLPTLSLADAAHLAVERNLDLLAQRFATEAGEWDIRRARANLLPLIGLDVTFSQLDSGNASVRAGAVAERSTTAAVSLSQVLWSEPARAGVDIERLAQRGRQADLEALRLDIVQLATVAFLDLLRAETQVRVQRDDLELTRANLELAKDRRRVGASTASDLYRWQSRLAAARQRAIAAYADRLSASERLNRILHRPLTTPVLARPASLDEPGLLIAGGRLEGLVDDPKAFYRLTNLMIEEGLDRSPELVAIDAAIDIKERQIASIQREAYLPGVALQGQLSHLLDEQRAVPSPDDDTTWSIAINAGLTLFSGGDRRARRARAELELAQLSTQRASLSDQIEQSIRANLHRTNASYMSIDLAQQGAVAAGKSLELVRDAYAQGAVRILDLLDAQSAALQAQEAASNSVFTFLVDLMNAQRATGRFDFFLAPAERDAEIERLTEALSDASSDVPSNDLQPRDAESEDFDAP